MQNRKSIGRILLGAGIILLVVSLLADVVGVGQFPDGFGWKQMLGSLAGLGMAIAGFTLARG